MFGFDLKRCPRKLIKPQSTCLTVSAFDDRDSLIDIWSWQDDAVHDRPCRIGDSVEFRHSPVLRDVAKPLDAGGLEAHGGVEATGHGPVDDGPLLLVEQRNQ